MNVIQLEFATAYQQVLSLVQRCTPLFGKALGKGYSKNV